jgi:hypothetical protein
VRVPRDWRSGVIRLHVGAADYYSEVKVNDFLVGSTRAGYLPFDLEVQEFLRAGEENTISIKVADGAPARGHGRGREPTTGRRASVAAVPVHRDPARQAVLVRTVGGIWQSVCWSAARTATRSRTVRPRPDVGGRGRRCACASPTRHRREGTACATSPAPPGAAVAPVDVPLPGARQSGRQPRAAVPDPALWDPNPHLYGLACSSKAAKSSTRSTTRFGMRTIEAKTARSC